MWFVLEVDIKLQIFYQHYNKLASVLPIKSLTSYFVKENVISHKEEKTIQRMVGQSQAVFIVLEKIHHSLETHSTESFDALMSIMEQHGDTSSVQLVKEMRQDLSQSETG